MPRPKSNKPKRNIWTDPSPYGEYEGERGNPAQWRSTFNQRFTREEVVEILQADSPYALLGVADTATEAEIKSAFRKLMMTHHPDKGGNPEMARKIIAAYQHLTDK
jgi:DnaJ-class molecular chaperone